MPLLGRSGRGTLWVFVRGHTVDAARGADIEIVEPHRQVRADRGEAGGGGYWWAVFERLPYGDYTVRVRFPGGGQRESRVAFSDKRDQVRVDEP